MRIYLNDSEFADVDVYKKDIKNLTLKIYPDGNIKLSVPRNIPESSIREFLNKKRAWIKKHLSGFKPNMATAPRFWHLGTAYEPQILMAESNGLDFEADKALIMYKEGSSPFASLDMWQRNISGRYFRSFIDSWSSKLSSYGIPAFKFSVRRMKSLWGSCTPKKCAVRFNYYLLCAPEFCIDYIVLHEMAHFLYGNHGERFRAFLTAHMPDWQDRKKALNAFPYIADMQNIESILKNYTAENV